jgi:hypothetical protein
VYHRFALVALLLPLSGCYVPPQGSPYGYAQPGYPASYGEADYAYPGYAYNGGSPTLYADGATWPLVFYGGGWGYWDGYHRWHGAPAGVWHDLDRRHPGGVGYHQYGGGPSGGGPTGGGPTGGGSFGRPVGAPGGSRGFGAINGQPGGQPGGGQPGGGRAPAAAPRTASAPHTGGGHPAPARRDDHH